MEIDLAGLLQGRVDTVRSDLDDTATRAWGLTVGPVTAVGTTSNAGSVKVKLPLLDPSVETDWAPVVTGWAGRTGARARGAYLPPAVDDQAVVAFRQGDPRHAYVLGFVWSQDAPPPEPTESGLQRHGLFGGRGTAIVLDDTPGAVRVRIVTGRGHRIELDDAGQTVTVSAATGNDRNKAVITLGPSGVTVDGTGGEVSVSADRLSLSGGSVTLRSDKDLTIAAGGTLSISGKAVTIN